VSTDVLRHKGKHRKPAEKRGKFMIGASISNRPDEVKDRKIFGHWELDSMVSSRGKSKGCLATFAERKSRLYTAVKMPNRTSDSMEKAICQLHKVLPAGAFKTGTDRGKEFACYHSVENSLGIALYFADPYSSWQKGACEKNHTNIRLFLPKGSDFDALSQRKINRMLCNINSVIRRSTKEDAPFNQLSVTLTGIVRKLDLVRIDPENVALRPSVLK